MMKNLLNNCTSCSGLLGTVTFSILLGISIGHAADPTVPVLISKTCTKGGDVEPERFSFSVQLKGNEQKSEFKLSQIFCNSAAYNTSQLWVLEDQYGDVKVVSFAIPEFDVSYADKQEQTTVNGISITGYSAETEISNSTFAPETLTITSFHKWRGIGDASSGGTWAFRNGRFVLQSFDVDASWDGEINSRTIVKFDKSAK